MYGYILIHACTYTLEEDGDSLYIHMYILCVYAQELGGGGVRPLPYVIHAAKFGVIVEL